MSDNNQKENNKVSIKPFIILFGLSIIIFGALYFCHSKKIENRFNNTLQNYEKSMSYIFNNIITNRVNENIYTNSFQTNNNQLQNDSIEKLKLSFEIGFKMLESSMNEIMKNSNDILQFWFAFLSVIMIVFTLIGFFLNNNILDSAKKQLEMVEKEATDSINEIKTMSKAENIALIGNMQIKADEEAKKLIQKLESEYNQTIEKFKYKTEKENNELIEKIKVEAKIETERLIEENNKNIQENELFNFGMQSVNSKDYQSVIYYFTEIINLNPKNLRAYNNRGNAKNDSANTKEKNSEEYNKLINEAIEDYNKAIELNSNYSIAYYNRGNAKIKLEKVEEAIKDFIKAYNLDNDNEIKENSKNQLISLAKQGYEAAIKFCEDNDIDYKN